MDERYREQASLLQKLRGGFCRSEACSRMDSKIAAAHILPIRRMGGSGYGLNARAAPRRGRG